MEARFASHMPRKCHRSHRSSPKWKLLIVFPPPARFGRRKKFFNAQNIAPIDIHRQLCQVYGPNIMSKQMVHRWRRQFFEGRQSVHDEDSSGRCPSSMMILLSLCGSALYRTVTSQLRS
ncbi:HTH_48 domain-containing protein [Trichonephila clavipes]|nr:HTH_48 domain-containing protein [Trichonephila clavipes]